MKRHRHGAKPMDEWKNIPWRKLERVVFKLQKRIYRAAQRGDKRMVRRLQRLLVSSQAAKKIAVRQVTQDNQGKKTAGVDGAKSLTPKQRQELAGQIEISNKAKPARRVWIPKPGRDEKRPRFASEPPSVFPGHGPIFPGNPFARFVGVPFLCPSPQQFP